MPSNQTPNYQLSQWEPGDQVLREDFNADNAKIDAALGGKIGIITGTYVGNQAESRFIDLGVTPKALLVFTSFGSSHGVNHSFGGLILPGRPVKDGSNIVCEIVDNGFKVYYKKDTIYGNNNYTYYYLAFI